MKQNTSLTYNLFGNTFIQIMFKIATIIMSIART